MTLFCRSILLITLLFAVNTSYAKVFDFNNPARTAIIGAYTQKLEDTGNMNFRQVQHATGFTELDDKVPNFGITKSSYWLKFDIRNDTKEPGVFLQVAYPSLDLLVLYHVKNDSLTSVDSTGEWQPIAARKYQHQNFIFDLDLPPGQQRTYYLHVKSTEQILMPISVGSYEATFNEINMRDILSALYVGIILVMILYNLFVYYTVRDKSYLYYVLYILFVGLTQICFQGFTYRFLWPSSPWLANQSVILFPAITGIAAIEFFKTFLQVKTVSRRFIWVLNILNAFYVVNCILSISGAHRLSQQLLQPNAMIASLFIVYMAVVMLRKGSRSAGFFLAAWITFLVGIIIFIMKDVGVIPFNNFTNYILHIGSAIEVVVLSFALADKINIFRKEKEESQEQALAALEENARIIREQNVILETKVTERTHELKISNEELNKTLQELKEAEMQLVESEKMASLGQLTAGIAHEINNPINFVTSNVKPLKRDVEMIIGMLEQVEQISLDAAPVEEKQQKINELKEEYDFDYLKTEIDYLLKGITEGSSRTAEIVKGLRIFSRLDEDDLKKASINEGLDSTTIIINNLLDNRIQIEKHYGNIPMVECYPGKLNQVFLNIMTNAIHAIKSRFKDTPGGKLILSTSNTENTVKISISDNGTGMDENTKKKLFEPFFTTKDVGEGTGLGLSIAYNTIKKHNGTIAVNSELGVGTEFVIEIPIIH